MARLLRIVLWILDKYYFGHPMSYFITPLKTEAVDGGWILDHSLEYKSSYLGRVIKVPTGFFTDLASVPKLLQSIVPVANAKNRRAAVVHDYLCYRQIQEQYNITQADADRVFREALGVCNVSPVGQWAMWLPVRTYQAIKGIFR